MRFFTKQLWLSAQNLDKLRAYDEEWQQAFDQEILLDITNAPFDAEDATLLPAAGSCAACPKRTGNNPLLFPEIRHKSICIDRACYRAA